MGQQDHQSGFRFIETGRGVPGDFGNTGMKENVKDERKEPHEYRQTTELRREKLTVMA